MPEPRDSAEFVEALRQRTGGVWRQFMVDFGPLIRTVARRLGLSEADQEDVFQSTCLSAFRSIDALRDPTKLRAWVVQIAHHHGLDRIRRRKRELPTEPDGQRLLQEPDREKLISEVVELAELATELNAAMAEMDERCRRLLSALYLQDPPMSYEELARTEGLARGSVGPIRARCLDRLRKFLLGVSSRRLGTLPDE